MTESIPVIEPCWQAPVGVRALATTRRGGISTGPWASLNLGENSGDDASCVRSNRERLNELLPGNPLWLNQVHGTRAVEFSEASPGISADAIISRSRGEVCAVLTADCLPVLFASRSGDCVAAAHAGWRGLAAGVLESTIEAMGIRPDHLTAWIGPAISVRHYQVGDEVRKAFVDHDPAAVACFVADGSRWKADLPGLARQRLEKAGMTEISDSGLCTFEDEDRFYSYRRDGRTGRMASLVWIA